MLKKFLISISSLVVLSFATNTFSSDNELIRSLYNSDKIEIKFISELTTVPYVFKEKDIEERWVYKLSSKCFVQCKLQAQTLLGSFFLGSSNTENCPAPYFAVIKFMNKDDLMLNAYINSSGRCLKIENGSFFSKETFWVNKDKFIEEFLSE